MKPEDCPRIRCLQWSGSTAAGEKRVRQKPAPRTKLQGNQTPRTVTVTQALKLTLLGSNSEASQLSTSVIDRPGRAGYDVTTPRRRLGCPGTSREPNL